MVCPRVQTTAAPFVKTRHIGSRRELFFLMSTKRANSQRSVILRLARLPKSADAVYRAGQQAMDSFFRDRVASVVKPYLGNQIFLAKDSERFSGNVRLQG